MTQAVQRPPWLISARDDVAWLIGSSSFAFLVIAAYQLLTEVLGVDMVIAAVALSAVWTLSLDGTHLFATYSRTLLDRQFVRDQKAFLWATTVVFLAGPLFLLASAAAWHDDGMRASSVVFHRFALTWAYYHLCRQHWGVVVLYRNKHGETDVWGRRLEAWLMTAGFAYPYAHATAQLGISASPAESTWIDPGIWLPLAAGLAAAGAGALLASWGAERVGGPELRRAVRWLGVCGLGLAACIAIPNQLGLSTTLFWLERALAAAFVLSAAAAACHALLVAGRFNALKWSMIASALVTHNVILVGLSVPAPIALIAMTLFHNVQYHRIVRFHNVHRYANDSESEVGWAKRVTDSLRLFAGLSVGFSLAYLVLRSAPLGLSSFELGQYAVSALVWGIAFHHYVIDAVIWRPSRSRRLSVDLRIAS